MRAQYLCAAAIAALLAVTSAQASVEINANPTKNMNCADGVCSPTAKSAVLNTTDLANMLATSDVKITTGNGAVTITVSGSFSWTSTHRLTLDANLNVSFRVPVEVAGQGAVTIITSDGGTSGDLLFFPSGKLDFWDTASSLSINGNSYTLVQNIAALAADIKKNPFGSYALATDYDASVDGTYSKSPIKTFDGAFEGLGHTLRNLAISATRATGLFRLTNSTATLRDIHIAGANVVCDGYSKELYAGILVGKNGGLITNASVGGSMLGASRSKVEDISVGGLAGINDGTIRDSNSSASVFGSHAFVGGLVGYDLDGVILRARATGDVSGVARSVTGGLAGFGNNIDESYATGAVTEKGENDVGGLVGRGSAIFSSYAMGSVKAGKHIHVGGLIGEGYDVRSSYSVGSVDSRGPLVGGFIGFQDTGALSDTYWDLDTSGISNPHRGAGNIPDDPGITGLSDAQLKSALPAGFDPAIWAQSPSINNGYPYLIANPPPQ